MINYKEILKDYNQVLKEKTGDLGLRSKQLSYLVDILEKNFEFDKVVCLETGASQNWDDGCVGYFFGKVVQSSKGKFVSVDNNYETHKKSIKLYDEFFKNLDVENYYEDSVSFIKNTEVKFNLIHLDSWDLDLKNPLPSMLHGWREFESLKDKVNIGTIVVIDDNFFQGTWVDWIYNNGNSERIDINYPIVGKGGLIYHFCEDDKNGWRILSEPIGGINNKIVIKKIK